MGKLKHTGFAERLKEFREPAGLRQDTERNVSHSGGGMRPVVRWPLAILGALLLLFGLACLNYTKVAGLEYRRAFAERHGILPPGPLILYGGMASVVLGSGLLGFVLGRSRKKN
jgi:hypothetical protein